MGYYVSTKHNFFSVLKKLIELINLKRNQTQRLVQHCLVALIAPRDMVSFWTVLPATLFSFLIFQCMDENQFFQITIIFIFPKTKY